MNTTLEEALTKAHAIIARHATTEAHYNALRQQWQEFAHAITSGQLSPGIGEEIELTLLAHNLDHAHDMLQASKVGLGESRLLIAIFEHNDTENGATQ